MDKQTAPGFSTEPTAPPATQRETAWLQRFAELETAARQLGRLPRSTRECDSDLLAWITNQRRTPDMPVQHRAQLEALPGWDWDPRASAWEQRAEDLRVFIITHARAPRVRSTDPAERALAHWHSRQRTAQSSGSLSPERALLFEYVTKLSPG